MLGVERLFPFPRHFYFVMETMYVHCFAEDIDSLQYKQRYNDKRRKETEVHKMRSIFGRGTFSHIR